MPSFPSLSHVALTVTDLDRSIEWYERLLGTPPLVVDTDDEAGYRFAVWLEPMIGLHEHSHPDNTVSFDEHRPGLDHVAFHCQERVDLDEWQSRLEELGIAHGAIREADYGFALAFRDPDHLALEFFTFAPQPDA